MCTVFSWQVSIAVMDVCVGVVTGGNRDDVAAIQLATAAVGAFDESVQQLHKFVYFVHTSTLPTVLPPPSPSRDSTAGQGRVSIGAVNSKSLKVVLGLQWLRTSAGFVASCDDADAVTNGSSVGRGGEGGGGDDGGGGGGGGHGATTASSSSSSAFIGELRYVCAWRTAPAFRLYRPWTAITNNQFSLCQSH